MIIKPIEELKELKMAQPEVVVLILKTDVKNRILGRELFKWVGESAKGYDCVCADYNNEEIISFVNSFNFKHDYAVVLLDKIPLITPKTLNHLIDYCTMKKVNACKFSGGYVFSIEYVKNCKSLFFDSVYMQNQEDFYVVEGKKGLAFARDVLQQRIINNHILNGVEIINTKNVEIEPDVEIEKNVVIYKGNTLKGCTLIKENVILKENNVIENSVVENDACVCGSTVTDSKIGVGCIIMPYCHIDGCVIGKNCTIKSNNSLIKQKIKNNQTI